MSNYLRSVSMPCQQRGAAGIIAVLVLIVVVVLMVRVIADRATTNLIDSSLQNNSIEAMFLAESGIERAAWRYLNQEVWCDSNGLGETNIEMISGSGNTVTLASYKTDVLGNPLSSGLCRIVATATMASNGVSRTIDAIIAGSVLVEELFPDISRWLTAGPTGDIFYTNCAETTRVTTQANGGGVVFDAVEDSTGDGGGSFNVYTKDGKKKTQTGYRTYTSIKQAQPGDVLTIYHDYKRTKGKRANKIMMAIDLVSTVGDVYRVWCDQRKRSTKGWITDGAFNWTVPAGKYIDKVRIGFHLKNRNNRRATANNIWIDNLKITF